MGSAVLIALVAGALAGPASGADADFSARPAAVRAWQTGAFAPDRFQHASLAFSAGLALGIVTREPGAAAGGALALGLAKEIADRKGNGFDAGDLLADAVGAALAALATAALRR